MMKRTATTVDGQRFDDRVKVEIGRGDIYINAGDDYENTTAMLSTAAARVLADLLREAADRVDAEP